MNFQSFARSGLGVSLGLALGRLTPPALSYRIAGFAAGRLARNRDAPIVRAIRANQWVVRGERATPEELDVAVREVFAHAGRCFADLYRNLTSPEGLKQLSPADEVSEKLVAQSQDSAYGAFVVAPHLSNFDLVLLAHAYRGLKGQVLTYGNPTGGYKIQNQIRASTGLDITPVNEDTHRKAVETMRNGGFVYTAVDRPISGKTQRLSFFGRPSPLPAGHIRMALDADVPVIVAAAQMGPDCRYYLRVSDPLQLQRHRDPDTEIRLNGEAVLARIERYIRESPSQWLMYYPVWPETLQQAH